MKLWKQGRTEGTAIVPDTQSATRTQGNIPISQPGLAGEMNGRVNPIAASTAAADEGTSE
jgi:hypothetical protein